MFLSLVFHNHQPIGQLPWTFEDAWRDSYQPFLDVLEKHPGIKVALHYTGPLLDWLLEHKPKTIAQVRSLVQAGQVEVLGGGYYEPILAIWPVSDQITQLVRLRERVQEVFGTEPPNGTPDGTPDRGTLHGLWLAERIWEPPLVDVIAAMMSSGKSTLPAAQQASNGKTGEASSVASTCGAYTCGAYTFIDSTVFEAAGIPEEQSFGYFQVTPTSPAGATHASSTKTGTAQASGGQATTAQPVYAFPINQPLRYLIPWQEITKSLEYFRHIEKQRRPESLVVFADDGEKFGGWPGTFDWVQDIRCAKREVYKM